MLALAKLCFLNKGANSNENRRPLCLSFQCSGRARLGSFYSLLTCGFQDLYPPAVLRFPLQPRVLCFEQSPEFGLFPRPTRGTLEIGVRALHSNRLKPQTPRGFCQLFLTCLPFYNMMWVKISFKTNLCVTPTKPNHQLGESRIECCRYDRAIVLTRDPLDVFRRLGWWRAPVPSSRGSKSLRFMGLSLI